VSVACAKALVVVTLELIASIVVAVIGWEAMMIVLVLVIVRDRAMRSGVVT